jgi:quinoprotein glucose dehydrogenase
MVVGDLLLQTTEDLRGDADVSEAGAPLLHARDKRTGEILASLELPVPGQYGMMTYEHEGRQYVVLQAGSAKRGEPGQLVALRLP